ncbi:hypothetical protein LX97_00589 [Nonlabens dokdonensis]|uniref:Uncharacterized protein n=2 Tax=Nonlabens dokdonensis TaxID=328515 RepID=L7WAK1_NONDD|nr:hypothetical protein [Nonlabens dokdonensis]AGC75908.1 hypothetical protein DDD_0781 [Nonlabens dokdonensis DSW-6]PZX43588.1 hypothetical protein LX97_00589 [Nonlabens dokdonensis]
MNASKEVMTKVQLVDSKFSPSEAADVVSSLIREKINFHKLHRLSMCEGNVNSNTKYDDSRVVELDLERKKFKEICREAKANGKRIKINGILEIEIID